MRAALKQFCHEPWDTIPSPLLPTVHVRPSAAPLIMQVRPHRCLRIRAGRVDPDLVAILTGAGRVAVLAVFIAIIIANPRPRIFIKDYLRRFANCSPDLIFFCGSDPILRRWSTRDGLQSIGTTGKRILHPGSHKTIYYLSTLAPARTNPPRPAPVRPQSRHPTGDRRGTGRRRQPEASAEARRRPAE